jgi:hypothetical protein
VLSSLAAWAWHHTAGAGTAAAAVVAALRQRQRHQEGGTSRMVGRCGRGMWTGWCRWSSHRRLPSNITQYLWPAAQQQQQQKCIW